MSFTCSGRSRVEVEVIIDQITDSHLIARLHEQDKQRQFQKAGVKVRFTKAPYAILSLSERQAINYNLV